MPRATKVASKTAKKGKDDLCILNCPPIKDHLSHAGEHLAAMLKSGRLPPKQKKNALDLQKLIFKAQDHINNCQFQAGPMDPLPEPK